MFGGLHCTILICLGVQAHTVSSSSTDCNLTDPDIEGFFPFIAIVMYYTSLLGLTTRRVLEYFRAGDRRITFIILQDVLVYTVILACTSIATLTICTTLRPALRGLPVSLSATLAAITSSRMVLNLKKIAIEPDSVTFRTLTSTPMTLDTLGPICFRSRAQVDWEEGCLPPK
ncbi:hypothetical protein L218DRAFT_495785 [Marasmius fiardii PR-910]|nr:hypothetical protein L218DRAFT_495785 [Marasmius fiardii PR-910]